MLDINPSEMADEFLPFWQGTKRGYLSFPQCADCERFHWYPLKICPSCRSSHIKWTQVNGSGEVFSWTAVRIANFAPSFEDKLPYIVGLIEFKDAPGVRLITNIVEADPGQMDIGMVVEPVFRKVDENFTLVFFKPTG